MKNFITPGDLGFKSFKTSSGNLGILICWDQWFPEAARLTVLKKIGNIILSNCYRLASKREKKIWQISVGVLAFSSKITCDSQWCVCSGK